jgi:hypothetical protein
VYVISHGGELGPVPVQELGELLAQGKVDRQDQVRSGFGAVLGTVDDLVSGRVKVGSDANRFASAEEEWPAPDGSQRPGSMPLWLIIGIVMVMGLGGLLLLRGPIPATTPRTDTDERASLPAVSLQPGEAGPAGTTVRIMLTPRQPHPVTVKVALLDAGTDARLVPANGQVIFPIGSSSETIAIQRRRLDPGPRAVQVILVPEPSYDIAEALPLSITVPEQHPPSIARDPFFAGTSGLDTGWSDERWNGLPLRLLDGAFPPSGPGATGTSHYAQIDTRPGEWANCHRTWSRALSRGRLWASLTFNAPGLRDGRIPWAEVMLTQNGDARIGFGTMSSDDPKMPYWWMMYPQPREEDKQVVEIKHPRGPIRMVLRCDLGDASASIFGWLDPLPGSEPREAEAARLPSLPPMSLNGVRFFTGDGGSLQMADLRIGTSWEEVIPAY